MVTVQTLLFAVGSRNVEYYRAKWTSYASNGVPIFDWNWAALIFGWLWFAYRKLWLVCLAYYIMLFPLYEVIGRTTGKVGFIVTFLIFKLIVVPLFVNQLYFYYVKKKASKLAEKVDSPEELVVAISNRFQTVFDATASNPKVF